MNALKYGIAFFICLFVLSCVQGKTQEKTYQKSSTEDEYIEFEIPDGVYSADVDYYNPNTGFSNVYTLDIDVFNNCVEKIYFDNGGWLDVSEEIDESGEANVVLQDGREFDIHLDLSEIQDYD